MKDLSPEKILVCGLLLPVLLGVASGSAASSGERQQEFFLRSIDPETLASTVELVAEPNNEIEFETVELDTFTDGSSQVRMKLALEPGQSETFIYMVDKVNGTYLTERVPRSFMEDVLERRGLASALPDEADRWASRMTPGVEGIGPVEGYNSCDYLASAAIIHFDPVLIELAITASTMEWNHDFSSNCLSMGRTTRTCWANPQTNPPWPVDPTHWFVQTCSDLKRTLTIRHLQKTTHGYYFNWDFGDDNKQTWADHFIQIDATTGIATFLMADNDGGESSLLIFGVQSASITDLGCE